MSAIACCKFPTTLLVVDDDQDLLENFKYALLNQYKCICTSNIIQAKEILTTNYGWTKSLFAEGFSREFVGDSAKFSVGMDISSLHKKIYDVNRFNHIAILIIDYDMPDMNGLDFIRSLGDHRFKIIMLTGKASQDTVIKAFNDREIHRYVSKGEPNYSQVINYIEELQQEFFVDCSKFILESMKTETEIFDNHNFQRLFSKITQENNIVEYYLLDESGSFLMLDATAENQVWLIVKSKDDMNLLYHFAVDDSEAPIEKLEKIKNKEVLTYFKTKKEFAAKVKDWNLINCQPLDETKEFYFAVVKNNEKYKIDRSEIKPYADFLNESE